jgi:hypothetical protein
MDDDELIAEAQKHGLQIHYIYRSLTDAGASSTAAYSSNGRSSRCRGRPDRMICLESPWIE